MSLSDRPDETIQTIGTLTTDPRWSHIESPLLWEFALAVLDSLAMNEAAKTPTTGRWTMKARYHRWQTRMVLRYLERLAANGYEWSIRRVSE